MPSDLLHRLLTYSVVPQVLLLFLLAWWLLRVIQRDLQPLAELQSAVDRRDAKDLTPVPSAVTTGASTRDVERLGLAVNSMLERLSENIKAQREFAGNIAHELRTPLAGIRAQADYALANSDPMVWREQLQGIAQGEARASHMVEQLLALALADEAKASLRLERIAINELRATCYCGFYPKPMRRAWTWAVRAWMKACSCWPMQLWSRVFWAIFWTTLCAMAVLNNRMSRLV